MPSRSYLTPYERWASRKYVNKIETSSLPVDQRLEQKYGPTGVALIGAGYGASAFGGLVVVVGIVSLIASGAYPAMETIGWIFLVVGLVMALLGFVRLGQASRAGAAFRDGGRGPT